MSHTRAVPSIEKLAPCFRRTAATESAIHPFHFGVANEVRIDGRPVTTPLDAGQPQPSGVARGMREAGPPAGGRMICAHDNELLASVHDMLRLDT